MAARPLPLFYPPFPSLSHVDRPRTAGPARAIVASALPAQPPWRPPRGEGAPFRHPPHHSSGARARGAGQASKQANRQRRIARCGPTPVLLFLLLLLPLQAHASQEGPGKWHPPPALLALMAQAKSQGLWNLFLHPEIVHDMHPDVRSELHREGLLGAGLTHAEYLRVAELMGRYCQPSCVHFSCCCCCCC